MAKKSWKRPRITEGQYNDVLQLSDDIAEVPPDETRSFDRAIDIILQETRRLRKLDAAEDLEDFLYG